MSRSRSEMPHRQSARGPLPLRTSSSSSDSVNTTTDPPKLGGDRRSSPRSDHSPPMQKKKLGTRIADLESQLCQAQGELKSLKEQLASAEAAKNQAQQELESNQNNNNKKELEEEGGIPQADDVPQDDGNKETDVFEVPVEEEKAEGLEAESGSTVGKPTHEPPQHYSVEPLSQQQPSSSPDEGTIFIGMKDEEINALKAKLEEKEKELESKNKEDEELKKQLSEAASRISSAAAKEGEMVLRLSQLGEELEESRRKADELKCELETMKEAKQSLEGEMKRMRIQTEQWRKAADAAAAMLAGGNGRMIIPERCDENPATRGYSDGFIVASPGFGDYNMDDDADDDDDDGDGFGSGKQKRRGSGIKKFGDLWKRKPQK